MENSLEDFITKKHKRLLMIATTAAVFSWLVLVFFVLATISEFVAFFRIQDIATLKEYFDYYPETYVNIFLEMTYSLFQGVAFFLVLRGVFLGLNMIVETELNYRDELEGDSHGK